MTPTLWSPLYDAVALGMFGYGRAAFRVRVVAPADESIDEGTLYVAAHREETDVPIICGSYYFAARVWSQRWPRLHFAARDDLFRPGFFAGFPPDVPRSLRRALYPLEISRFLDYVRVHPISSANTMKLGQALEMIDPDTPLEGALPHELRAPIDERAAALGIPPPACVRDVDDADYADLLWRDVEASDLPGELFEQVWPRRAAEATADMRTIVDLVKAGEPLLLFPEGRPSPDGDLGPLRRGLGAVIRRGKPAELRAFGLAYDPLASGRPSVVMSVMRGIETPTGRGEPDLLPYLASAIALTCGQVVAAALVRSADEGKTELSPRGLEATIAEARNEAVAMGRVVDPVLEKKDTRRQALERSLQGAADRGALTIASPRSIVLNRAATQADPVIARLAKEHASVLREMRRAEPAAASTTSG